MTDKTKAWQAAHAKGRLQALEEAVAVAQRLAKEWQEEAEGTHSSHHSNLRRTWADAAGKVAQAIAELAREGGSEEPQAHIPQHKRPHHL